LLCSPDGALDAFPESLGTDRREQVQPSFDLLEQREQALGADQLAIEHRLDVRQVVLVPAFELRERLRVEVEVPKRQLPLPADERTALLPVVRERDELAWRCGLDVHPQISLQPRQFSHHVVLLRLEPDVHIDRRAAPSDENRRGAAGQVADALPSGGPAGLFHAAPDLRAIYVRHSAALSKLGQARAGKLRHFLNGSESDRLTSMSPSNEHWRTEVTVVTVWARFSPGRET
jgi:hypothetical protein